MTEIHACPNISPLENEGTSVRKYPSDNSPEDKCIGEDNFLESSGSGELSQDSLDV